MDPFDKIANKFDTTFDNKIASSISSVPAFSSAASELVSIQTDGTVMKKEMSGLPSIDIKDRSYIEEKVKGMIGRCTGILDRLDNDMKDPAVIGPNMRMRAIEVYATMVNAISIQIRELRELNKMVMGIEMINMESTTRQAQEEKAKKEETVSMTPAQLCKIIQDAQANSTMNKITTTYEIVKENIVKE